MKTKIVILTIVCGLSISAAAQNAGSDFINRSPSQGTVGTNNSASLDPGDDNSNTGPGSAKFNSHRRLIEPGLNNPNLNNPNYRNNPNRRDYGGITNGFGSRAITNGFDYGAITNRFGSGVFSNGFGDGGLTNRFGSHTNYGSYNGFGTNNGYNYYSHTNRHHPPYITDPRVMENNGLNNTN